MKKQLGPSDAIFPVPAALIVSGVNEEANIITIARIGIPSPTPPTIGISVKKSRYSLELIRKTNEFSVNIPPASLFKEVDYCGIATGRKRKKFEDTGFTPLESSKIKPPNIKTDRIMLYPLGKSHAGGERNEDCNLCQYGIR